VRDLVLAVGDRSLRQVAAQIDQAVKPVLRDLRDGRRRVVGHEVVSDVLHPLDERGAGLVVVCSSDVLRALAAGELVPVHKLHGVGRSPAVGSRPSRTASRLRSARHSRLLPRRRRTSAGFCWLFVAKYRTGGR
jgi:hypothetical protein